MRKLLSVLCGALFCMACSDEEDPSIVGSWILDNNNSTKGLGLNFEENGVFSMVQLEVVSSASAHTAVRSGTYRTTASELSLEMTKSTCPGDVRDEDTIQYKLLGDTLGLSFPEGIIVLKRNTSSSLTDFILIYGCFINDEFVESPLVTLP